MISSLKVGLLVVNILCLFCALGLIVIGACGWRSSFVESVLIDTKGWCLTLGVIALLTGLLGSFVILFLSKLLEWLHFLAVLGLIIICLIHAILDFIGQKEIVHDAYTKMQEAYKDRNYDSIDTFQRELHCCGYKSKHDEAVKKTFFVEELIESCCDDGTDRCLIKMASNINCSSRVGYISTLSSIIACFAFITAVMLIILAVLLVLKFIHQHKVNIEHSVRYYEDDDDISDSQQNYSQQTSTYSHQPSTYSQQPSTYSQRPSTYSQQPSTYSRPIG